MSVQKNLQTRGVLLALETGSYGSGAPALVPATDGFKAYDHFEVTPGYLHDGQRDGTPGTGMQTLSPVGASGRKGMVDLVHYFKGPGAGYTASVRATVDRILRGFGMSATVAGGVGTETCTYAPIVLNSGVLSSLVGEFYTRGQKYTLKGAYVSKIVIEAKGYVVPKWTVSLAGIMAGVPVDAAVPAITYGSAALKTPKATNIGFTLTTGAQTFTPRVRELTITLERELVERANQNDANGDHGGLHLGDFKGSVEALFEATADVTGTPFVGATAIAPYRVLDAARDFVIASTFGGGGGQYNRFKFNAPNAHLAGAVQEERDGPVALWGATFNLDSTTEEAFDPCTLVTD